MNEIRKYENYLFAHTYIGGKNIVKRQIVLPSQEEYERRKYYGKKFCLRNDTRVTRRRDSRD